MSKAKTTNNTSQPRGSDKSSETKKARLIALLRIKGGVTINELSKELGWQPHSTRAAMSGLRKAGTEIAVNKPDGDRVGRYRIAKGGGGSRRAKRTKVSS